MTTPEPTDPIETQVHTTTDEAPVSPAEALVEEVSIDGMCGVY